MYIRRLRDLREDNDLTQQKIANLMYISRTTYSEYERCVRNIPLQHLLFLADFYNTSTDYLLGRTNIINPYNEN